MKVFFFFCYINSCTNRDFWFIFVLFSTIFILLYFYSFFMRSHEFNICMCFFFLYFLLFLLIFTHTIWTHLFFFTLFLYSPSSMGSLVLILSLLFWVWQLSSIFLLHVGLNFSNICQASACFSMFHLLYLSFQSCYRFLTRITPSLRLTSEDSIFSKRLAHFIFLGVSGRFCSFYFFSFGWA